MFLAACFLAGSGRPASAIADPTELAGRWSGFLGGVGDPDIRTVVLDISSTKNRRFEGVIRGFGNPEIKIEGTLSATDIVDVQGTFPGADRARFRAHGNIRSVGNPEILGDPGVRIAALSYETLDARGRSLDRGEMVVVRMEGGAEWAETAGTIMTGPWAGDAPSLGNRYSLCELGLLNLPGPLKQRTSALAGTATFHGLSLPQRSGFSDLTFELLGTVGDPQIAEGASRVGLVGSDPESGIVAILAGLVRPEVEGTRAGIDGRYLLFESLAAVLDWIRSGDVASIESGDLYLLFDWGVTYLVVSDIAGEEFGSTVEGTITFPFSSLGDTSFDIAEVVSYDLVLSGYALPGAGWHSNDPGTGVFNPVPMPFGVGAIGDPILRPALHAMQTPGYSDWHFDNHQGGVKDLTLHTAGWTWRGTIFGEWTTDRADSVSQAQTSWHLERSVP